MLLTYRRRPGSRKPHEIRIPTPGLKPAGTSFAGLTLVAYVRQKSNIGGERGQCCS
jgi:hypothetical protein